MKKIYHVTVAGQNFTFHYYAELNEKELITVKETLHGRDDCVSIFKVDAVDVLSQGELLSHLREDLSL